MPEPGPHARLIDELASDLRPVGRLPPAWLRASAWSGAAVALAVLVVTIAHPWQTRGGEAFGPDLVLAVIAPAVTGFASAWAAFMTSVPGSDRRWALFPLPPLLIWMGSGGLGCLLRLWSPVEDAGPPPAECLAFILAVSLPLSCLMFLMLNRAMPLQPGLTAALGGLAAASVSAALLGLVHRSDAAVLDLLVHAGAVLLVVAASRLLGARYLSGRLR